MPIEVCSWTAPWTFAKGAPAHAALRIDQTYITWFMGGSHNSSLPGGGQLVGQYQAHANLGFKYVKDKNSDRIRHTANVLNDAGQPKFSTVNFDEENRGYTASGRTLSIEIVPEYKFDRENNALTFGIRAAPILSWWDAVMRLPPDHQMRIYQAASKESNCCSIVMKALRRGGMEVFQPYPNSAFYNDIPTLLSWVRPAINNMRYFSNEYERLDNSINNDRTLQDFTANAGQARPFPSHGTWKQWSDEGAVKFFGMARRKADINELDKLVIAYWAHNRDSQISRHCQHVILQKILWFCMQYADHIRERKTTGHRIQGVKRLFQSAAHKLEELDNADVSTDRESILPMSAAEEADFELEVSRLSNPTAMIQRSSMGRAELWNEGGWM